MSLTRLDPDPSPDSQDVAGVLHWLAGLAATRLTGSEGERAVQQAIANRLQPAGYQVQWVPFEAAPHIYGSMALHFGLVLALLPLSTRWPLVAAAAHLFLAFSWWSEAVRRRHVLRKLWPKVKTQSLLLRAPVAGTPRKRVVLLAHADSAFTGLMFSPHVLRHVAKPPPAFLFFLKKQLWLPWVSLLVLGIVEAVSAFVAVPGWLTWLLALPSVPVFVLNLDVVLRNQVVPGAADNLSGCAAQVVLAERWRQQAAQGVEVVFAFTGAEEAGTLGAAHLARSMGWDRETTEVLVLDTLTNGDLFLLEEGELWRVPAPSTLVAEAQAAARDCAQAEPVLYAVPAGATDALPFLVEGYRALALTCIDRDQHAPRHYHHPTDTAANADVDQLRRSTQIAWRLLERLAR